MVLWKHEGWEHWRGAEWGTIEISLWWGEEETVWMEAEGERWRGPVKTQTTVSQCRGYSLLRVQYLVP